MQYTKYVILGTKNGYSNYNNRFHIPHYFLNFCLLIPVKYVHDKKHTTSKTGAFM